MRTKWVKVHLAIWPERLFRPSLRPYFSRTYVILTPDDPDAILRAMNDALSPGAIVQG